MYIERNNKSLIRIPIYFADKTCIPGGKSHASRQWDILISTTNYINDETTCIGRIPIQVVKEVTGASRYDL